MNKCSFAPIKFTKNEVKDVKVAVLATPRSVSAVLHGVSVAQRGVLVAPRSVPAALHGMLALQDTHGNTRGA